VRLSQNKQTQWFRNMVEHPMCVYDSDMIHRNIPLAPVVEEILDPRRRQPTRNPRHPGCGAPAPAPAASPSAPPPPLAGGSRAWSSRSPAWPLASGSSGNMLMRREPPARRLRRPRPPPLRTTVCVCVCVCARLLNVAGDQIRCGPLDFACLRSGRLLEKEFWQSAFFSH
jgi:hypothetical protein